MSSSALSSRMFASAARGALSVASATSGSSGSRLGSMSTTPRFLLQQNGGSQRREYHESVIDHFKNPRNVGKLDGKQPHVGSAVVGKASCGDVIKLQIEVDPVTQTIKAAKFKTFGCGSAIASSSVATEMIIGKSINVAAGLKNTDISSHLSLPPVKIHCSVLAEEAIQAAILDYKSKQSAIAQRGSRSGGGSRSGETRVVIYNSRRSGRELPVFEEKQEKH